MAYFRTRQLKDKTWSTWVMVRKGLPAGAKPLTATFTGDSEREAKDEAEDWARKTERQIRQKKYKDPRAARIRLEDAFEKYFKSQEL